MDFLTRVTLNHEKAKEIFEKLEKAEALLREVYIRALKQVFQEGRRFV